MRVYLHAFYLLIFCAHQLFADPIQVENINSIIFYLSNADKDELKDIGDRLDIETDIYKLLRIKNYLFDHNEEQRNLHLAKAIDEVLNDYKTMRTLSNNGSLQEKLEFLKTRKPIQIERIYEIRNVYDRLGPRLGYEAGPRLLVTQLHGIYQGISAIRTSLEQRTFQKAFYTLEYKGKDYAIGHNISAISPKIGSDGFFRIYQDSYPVYKSNGRVEWKDLEKGTISLSYENRDLKKFEGMRLDELSPQVTNYGYVYGKSSGKKRMVGLGGLIYGNLKDNALRINNDFIVSKAFRDPNTGMGTHFLIIKKCDEIDQDRCPNSLDY